MKNASKKAKKAVKNAAKTVLNLTKVAVERAAAKLEPKAVLNYFVQVSGKKFPVRQLVIAAGGPADTKIARGLLAGLGYTVKANKLFPSTSDQPKAKASKKAAKATAKKTAKKIKVVAKKVEPAQAKAA